jgi:uncharacterized membrane protein
MSIVLILFYLLSPAFILLLCKKYPFFDKFGAVGIAYILGLVIGNLHILDASMVPIQDNFTKISISLALPLILISINIKQWSRLAGTTALSMLLGIFAIVSSIIVGFFFFGNKIQDSWQVAGLLTGVYLGATFNMSAIQIAIRASDELFGIVNAIDILVSIFYFFFLITVAQRIFNKFLPKFKTKGKDKGIEYNMEDNIDGWDAYRGIFSKTIFIPLLMVILIAAGIAAVSLLLSNFLVYLFPGTGIFSLGYIILSITTLSILSSLIPQLNRVKKTFQSGMYLILIFCVVVGSKADLTMFANTSFYLLWYVVLVIFGSLFLHFLLAWIFKIDTDTVLISSAAMILSPPFVPAIANAFHNREIIISGITVGIVGYSIGNYIGIALAFLLR